MFSSSLGAAIAIDAGSWWWSDELNHVADAALRWRRRSGQLREGTAVEGGFLRGRLSLSLSLSLEAGGNQAGVAGCVSDEGEVQPV